MKLSLYNCYVVRGNDTIVYNTKVESAVAFNNQNDIEAVKAFLEENPTQELEDLGLITSDSDEVSTQKREYYKMKFGSTKKLNIMLVMTYECNCNCAYCFENLKTYPVNSEEKADDVVDYLVKLYKANNCDEMDLHFFGGEPTLRIDTMIYVVNKLLEVGINVNTNVITNGTLLCQDAIDKLIDADITTFQITLDGPKAIHDKRRPMKCGKSSWEAIIENLTLLAKKNASISIRINVDSTNVEYLPEICQSIPEIVKQSAYTTIYIAPVVGCKIENLHNTLQDRTSFLKRAWQIISENHLPIAITPPVYAPCPYSSFESAFYIDLYGNVYTCGGFVGKEERIERVFDKKTDGFWDRISYHPKDSCFRCTYFPVCMGGCKYEEAALGGSCQYFYLKEVYDEYYTKYAIET